MGPGRGVLLILLLVPVLAPLAEAAPTYTFDVTDTSGQIRGNQATGTPGEFRIGETVRLRVMIQLDGSEQVTYTHKFRLFRGTSLWGEVGTGLTHTTGWTGLVFVTQDWATNVLSSGDAGKWRAEFDTNRGVLHAVFDLDHAPDFTITHVRVSHPNFVIPWTFARDGTTKTVEGCVQNLGPDFTVNNAVVGLYFKTHAEFLINSPGRTVMTSTVFLNSQGVSCASQGLLYPGNYVKFENWQVLQHVVAGTPTMYRVGLRADPTNTVWEVNENNNAKDVESTILPFVFLP